MDGGTLLMPLQTSVAGYIGPYDDPDRYTLTELKSRGGEGELWLGTVPAGGHSLPVAVKALFTSADPDRAAGRVREQAELLRSLDHPHIVKVREAFEGPAVHAEHAADTQTRVLYLVMNYVDGENLSTWVQRYPDRDILESTRIISRLAGALDYLHRGQGTGGTAVLHRDVKPANVIVGPDGEVRLVDFGMARLASAAAVTVVGTPAYLAPEVVAGAPVSESSDRYGLGAVAYFLFTGEAPDLSDAAATRAKLLAVRGIEDREGFADHIMAMLARDPAKRPTDIVSWAQSLAVGAVSQDFGTTRATAATPKKRRRVLLPVLMTIAVLIGAGAFGWWLLSDSNPADPDPVAGGDAAVEDDSSIDADGAVAEDEVESEAAPEAVAVPEVTGLLLEDAVVELDAVGLDHTIEYTDSGEPAGTVLEQDPRAGTEDVTSVALTIATEPLEMPDVTGMSLNSALASLESLGVEVTVEEEVREETPDGEVLSQDPEAGESFADEATVTVARQPVIVYLAQQSPVEGRIDQGTVRLSGDEYTRSLYTYLGSWGRDVQSAGFDLGRGFREFRAHIGMRDDSASSAEVKFEVYGDGRRLYEETFTLGDAEEISLDVTGVLRLELQMTRLSDSGTETFPVWADARLLGTPGEVPEAAEDEFAEDG